MAQANKTWHLADMVHYTYILQTMFMSNYAYGVQSVQEAVGGEGPDRIGGRAQTVFVVQNIYMKS